MRAPTEAESVLVAEWETLVADLNAFLRRASYKELDGADRAEANRLWRRLETSLSARPSLGGGCNE